MMSAEKSVQIFVGVDVSKYSLDVFCHDTGECSKLDNTQAAIDDLCRVLKKKKQPTAVKSDHEKKHAALVARRNQLLAVINQENNRLKQCGVSF